MNQLDAILREFLHEIKCLDVPKLGGEPPPMVDKENIRRFSEQLKRRMKANDRMVNLLLGLYAATFLVAALIVVAFAGKASYLQAVLGGSLLAITEALRRFWKEKTALDVVIMVIPNLSPIEVVKVIESLYYGSKHSSRRGPA